MNKFLLYGYTLIFFCSFANAQEYLRSHASVYKLLTDKTQGWIYKNSRPVNFDRKCSDPVYYFFFKKDYELSIVKKIDCGGHVKSSVLCTRNFQIIPLSNGEYGLRVNKFYFDIGDVVRIAVPQDEEAATDFHVINNDKQKFMLLKASNPKHDDIENRFE